MFSWESEVLSLMDGGHYEQAFARLRELESQTEDDSEEQYVIRVNEAECLKELGHFKEALELFEAFKKKDDLGIENKCLNLLSEARCFEGMGRFRNARRCLQQVRKLDTDGTFSISVEFVEIDIEFDEGRDAEAIERAVSFLNKYAEELADPFYEGSAHKLKIKVACELVNNRQSQRGIEAINQLLPTAKDEDQALMKLYLGDAYDDLGETDKAISTFKELVEGNATGYPLVKGHYHLGARYLKKGDAALAKIHFLEVERLGVPKGTPVKNLYRFLANASGMLGQVAEYEKYNRLAKADFKDRLRSFWRS